MSNEKKSKDYYVGQDVCAYFYAGTRISQLKGSSRAVPSAARAQALPLIVRQPQWVRFADQWFQIRQEGLYRFWDWGTIRQTTRFSRPMVINKTKRFTSLIFFDKDLLALFSALALVHVHGSVHQNLPFRQRLVRAKRGNLSLTCGYVSAFSCELLTRLGFRARPVSAIRVEEEYNSYDNGHCLFEIFWPKYNKWVLVDIDGHTLFVKNGKFLNLGEVSSLIQQGKDFTLYPLTISGIGAIDNSDAVAGRFNLSCLCEPIFLDPGLKRQWYRRILAIPLIGSDGRRWFFCEDPKARRRVLEYEPSSCFLDRREWLRKFYSREAGKHLAGTDKTG